MACLERVRESLPIAVAYRDYVALALADARTQDAAAFFGSKLGEVDEPTAPFGLFDVHGDGSQIEEAGQVLDPTLAQQVRIKHGGWG